MQNTRKMALKSLILLLTAYIAVASEISPEQLNGEVERIWRGKDATAGQFPYQALLIMTNAVDGTLNFCGGSLINTTYTLTAAHCCVNVSTTTVYMGLVKVADNQSDWVQRFIVPNSSFIVHKDYNPKTFANDICLLKLPIAAQLNANVSLITLPTQMDTNPSQYDWKSATVSGWGQTNSLEGLHPTLEWSTVIMKPHFFCALEYYLINPVSNNQLCSGKIPWTGPCHGDSGGPLTIKDPSGKIVEIGLVSWAVGICSSFNPIVYAYIPAFLDWIKQNMT